jgi:hypothetical protein
MRKVLGSYRNGNYMVTICDDGTKIRANNEDEFIAAFPESIDMKISNRCNMGCPQCHEKSVPNGALANLHHPLLDSLHSYTELALGGGNVFEHPDLDEFLFRMARKHIICNITVHAHHFIQYFNKIQYHVEHGTLHGIGVSVNEPISDDFINYLKLIPNVVVHVIAGVVPWETLVKLSNNNIKLLILGYKTFGRGIQYWCDNKEDVAAEIVRLKERLPYLFKHFPIVSFDNLALEQLNVKDFVDEKTWEKYYMGDDGQYTMYIDLVKQEYATSSVSPRLPIDSNKIEELFKKV